MHGVEKEQKKAKKREKIKGRGKELGWSIQISTSCAKQPVLNASLYN
jgi:hypothetical protein